MSIDNLMVLVELVKFFINNRFVSCKGQNDPAGDHYMHYCYAYHFYCFHHEHQEVCNYAVILNDQKQGL